MCGRFVMLTYDEVLEVVQCMELKAPFNLDSDWPAVRPIAQSGSTAPVVSVGEEGLVVQTYKWGFDRYWNKEITFNTRLETALSPKPGIWKTPIKEGRCIVPVMAFFETHGSEMLTHPHGGKSIKRQYRFASPDGHALLLAAVRNATSFSIVTTTPNRWVSPVHDRMPLVLKPEEVSIWLRGRYKRLPDRSDIALVAAPDDPAGYIAPPEQQCLLI